MPCCSISLFSRLDTRYCLLLPSRMPHVFSRNTRNCSKSRSTDTNQSLTIMREELASVCIRLPDPLSHSGSEIIRLELGEEVIRPRPFHHVLVEHAGKGSRSEEHTSELQSLMRISYAVFCLKKKKKNEYSQSIKTTISS